MIDEGKIIVIDDFISLEYQEKIKQDLLGLDNGVKPRAVADDLIYNSGNTYAVPIFLYKVQLGSSIHPEHVDAIHKASYNALTNWWTQSGIDVDIDKLMNYDPYLGRVTEPVQNQQ